MFYFTYFPTFIAPSMFYLTPSAIFHALSLKSFVRSTAFFSVLSKLLLLPSLLLFHCSSNLISGDFNLLCVLLHQFLHVWLIVSFRTWVRSPFKHVVVLLLLCPWSSIKALICIPLLLLIEHIVQCLFAEFSVGPSLLLLISFVCVAVCVLVLIVLSLRGAAIILIKSLITLWGFSWIIIVFLCQVWR